MNPAIDLENAKVFFGSCLDVLPTLADNSVDAIVTDPPYELGFMGKSWDNSGVAYSVELWTECLRVLKPGGHLLAFGGTRTWHRLAVAIEDAGFEIRDNIAWLYGSGFPKSLNVSKAIDKAAGAKREKIKATGSLHKNSNLNDDNWSKVGDDEALMDSNVAITDEAKQWDGWGTALKPAHEPIVVARKPVIGTVAQNVLKCGVGGLNIDATRIGTEVMGGGTMPDLRDVGAKSKKAIGIARMSFGQVSGAERIEYDNFKTGRFPANIILDEYTAKLLDEQADASRFFYVAKASKRDRNEGLDDLEKKSIGIKGNGLARVCETCGVPQMTGCQCPNATYVNPERKNCHPTVKPTALMQYLIRLVTPQGGTVLDPFTGSGSTGKAAILENKHFIGIELTAEYIPIIEGRLTHAYNTMQQQEDDLFE